MKSIKQSISSRTAIIILASFCLSSCMKCPYKLKATIDFEAKPRRQTTVGSNVTLFCNASYLEDSRHGPLSVKIDIYDKSGKVGKCGPPRQEIANCTIFLQDVDLSHNKDYFCIANVGQGLGCNRKDLALVVKDCTKNKTGLITMTTNSTNSDTVIVSWNYFIESCDQSIIIYWSNRGPVTRMSSSRELSNLEESSFEIKDLKPNRNYWVGMAIKTTKGISEIYRSGQPINITRCTKETCHENATCSHQDGLLNCTCKPGYSGNGSTCTVGCTKETCHVNATCRLQNGSVSCTCKPGYSGNGSICTEDEISPPTKAPRGDDDGGVSTPVIIFIVLFVCFLVIGAIIGLMIFKRRRKSNDAESATIIRVTNAAVANLGILFPEAEQSSPPVNVSTPIKKIPLDDVFEENEDGEIDSEYLTVLDEWELKRDRVLITNKKLGVGQFGIVKKGTYRTIVDGEENDEPVAVKLLKDKATEIDRSDLLTELRILKFVNTKPHQNILKLIGACTSEAPLMVITEYCPNGNLKELLKSFKSFLNGDLLPDPKSELRLTHEQLLKMAVDVCSGMEHLASMKFVHRDLAARNILIGESWIAKIADFGLSRETSSAGEYIKTHRNLLPVKWTAIEALVEGKFSTASDVWSFGVLLWEISNIGGEPYQGISPYDIMSHVGSGGRLQKPERCSPYLYEIMKECWETKPEKRPSFTKLHEKLSGMLQQSEKLYINVGFMDDVTKKDGVYERYTSA